MRRFECGAVRAALWATLLVACGDAKKESAAPGDTASAAPGDAASASAAAAPSEASGRGTTGADTRRAVLFLGTSLTAGLGLDADSAYPAQVQRLIDKAGLPFRVKNLGVSGETSAGLLQRLDWVLQDTAALVVVETGANDGLRGQPVEGTKATIGRVLDRIHAQQPGARVVLVQMEAMPNLGADYTRAFHGMFPLLAQEKRVTLMPFLLAGVAGEPELNQGDGIHPNYAGERIVTRQVWRTVGPILDTLSRGQGGPPGAGIARPAKRG